jgi:anti-anti-sigma factor
MLQISVEDSNKNVTLHCAGRLVRGEESSVLCAALRHRGRDIALDLGHVEAIDAAGLGALISLQAAGVYLQLVNPTRAVSDTLRLAHLDSVFEIRESQASPKLDDKPTRMAVAV